MGTAKTIILPPQRQTVRDVLDEVLDIAPSVGLPKHAKRSSQWPTIQRNFLRKHPRCAVCGGKDQLNAHHVIPFEMGGPELDEGNLIALCRGTFNCHLLFGHLGDYGKGVNPLVRADAETWRFKLRCRSVLARIAKSEQKGSG